MNVGTFWHRAFIAALTRLPPEKAATEADLALDMAVEHWDALRTKRGAKVPAFTPFDQIDVTEI